MGLNDGYFNPEYYATIKPMTHTGYSSWLNDVSAAKRNGTSLSYVCEGDSLTANQTSFMIPFRKLLWETFGYGGLGYVPFNTAAVAAEFNNSINGFGLSGHSSHTNTNYDTGTDDVYDPTLYAISYAATGTMTFRNDLYPFDTADLYYLIQPSGGTVKFGSGLNSTTLADRIVIDTNGAAKSIAKATYSKFGPTFGGNLMQAGVSPGPARLFGVDIKSGSTGIRVHRIAQGGTKVSQIAAQNGPEYTNFRKLLGMNGYMLNIGMNDTADTPDVFETNVRTILTRVRAANPVVSITIVLMNDTNDPVKNAKLDAFRQKLDLIKRDYYADIFDTRMVIGSFDKANARGYMQDGTHYGLTAGEMIAKALFKRIGGYGLRSVDAILTN